MAFELEDNSPKKEASVNFHSMHSRESVCFMAFGRCYRISFHRKCG